MIIAFSTIKGARGDAMTLRVQYKDGKYDYVDNRTLDTLIDQDLIQQFYRPSENKWVDVEADSVRGRIRFFSFEEQRWLDPSVSSAAGNIYAGAERRQGCLAA
jgi:hypothetical protein